MDIQSIEDELNVAAEYQDIYDLCTTNLIAPASPTPQRYTSTMLRHNAIAEGNIGNRLYAGVDGFNKIEMMAASLACSIFNADHANVQSHSVSQANQAVYQAVLDSGDCVIAMNFKDGGHLTHGLKVNFSGKNYRFCFYGLDDKGYINYDEIEEKVVEYRPKLLVCGGSSYPRSIDFKRIKTICEKVGTLILADLSHPAGFVAANRFPQPFPFCDFVTITLDKTMLGPHGGIILCKEKFAHQIDLAVHPGVQSSIPLRRIFEMALCLLDASKPSFSEFIDRIYRNSQVFSEVFSKRENLLVTGGTDTHIILLNTMYSYGITGKNVENFLEKKIGVLCNRQVMPGDKEKSSIASGIRIGTTWITARGYSEKDAYNVAMNVLMLLEDTDNLELVSKIRRELESLLLEKRNNDVWLDELEYFYGKIERKFAR